MARDEESNGNGNGSSGKSGRQDSSLSARRARLRSLAKQALPPDPYSKKQEPQADGPSLELEFMDQQQAAAGAAPAAQDPQQPTESWLGEAMKAITQPGAPAGGPENFPGGQQGAPMPTPDPQSEQTTQGAPIGQSPIADPNYQFQDPSYGTFPPDNQFPPDPFPNAQSQFPQNPSQFPQQDSNQFAQGGAPQFPAQNQFPSDPNQFPQNGGQFSQEQNQFPGAPGQMPGAAPAAISSPASGPSDPIFGEESETFESFMQGPAESPDSFMNRSESAPQAPFGMGSMQSDPNLGQQQPQNSFPTGQSESTPQIAQSQTDTQSQSHSNEVSYLPKTEERDFTSQLDLDYGDLDDNAESQTTTASSEDSPVAKDEQTAPIGDEAEKESQADSDSRAWEVNKPTSKIEDAWSVEDDGTTTVKTKIVPEPVAEEAPSKAEEPVKEPTPSRKKNRRKSEPEVVEKEPETQVKEEVPPAESAETMDESPFGEQSSKENKQSSSKKNEEKFEEQERAEKKLEDPSATRTQDPAPAAVPVELLSKSQAEALELLTSVDQALGICAMNLSSLQTAAAEQTDVLKNLRETLQNQTFFELGLNLNTLMESMSAALEPMKAVGELVPAIDQLVSAMVAQEDSKKEERLSPDKLVMSLADQLGTGQIDPWTFKCAYMAVYPDEHPADLLHRLVDLLGTQRLSGEMFRAAYDAVQAADPPRVTTSGDKQIVEVIKEVEVVKVVQDEEILRQLEDLRRANEDLKALVDDKDSDVGKRFEDREREFSQRLEEKEQEINKRLEEREAEYAELLAAKEHEIQETQEMLHSRFEEFNTRYEEMVETVNQRDEELKVKDDDLMRKESEITQLKAQLDELKESFKDTVDNLQKQLTSTQKAAQEAAMQAQQAAVAKPEEAKPQGSFFDQDSSKAAAQGGFMPDAAAAAQRPLFQNQMDTFNSMSKAPPAPKEAQAFGGAPPTPGGPATPPDTKGFGGGAPPTAPIPEPSNQAVPKPPQPSPGMSPLTGSGSYGSGVRAQVFEVIVRQALAGAPWREICAGPMSVNNISPEEVESEVKRREQLLKK